MLQIIRDILKHDDDETQMSLLFANQVNLSISDVQFNAKICRVHHRRARTDQSNLPFSRCFYQPFWDNTASKTENLRT